MAKTKSTKSKRTVWEFDVGDEVRYLYGLYEDMIGRIGVVVDRSKSHIKHYYKVKFSEEFIITVSAGALEKVNKEV